jgi:flavin-dependent dehydrogenase
VIKGAGLSGLVTALFLARHGIPVRVLERAEGPGSRFAGGFQVLDNFTEEQDVLDELRGLGIETDFDIIEARTARFFCGDRPALEARSERPYTYFVRRGDVEGGLDRSLLRQVRAAGGEVEFGVRGEHHCDVLATGPGGQYDAWARELVFETDAEDVCDVWFDHARAPFGYGYLFVIQGRGTAGVGIMGDPRRLPALYESFMAPLVAERQVRMDNPQVRTNGLSFFMPASFDLDQRPLRIGEAAGFQDPVFGLANRMAVRSAWLAASVLAGDQPPADMLRRLRRRQMSSALMRLAIRLMPDASTRLFSRWVASRDTREAMISLLRHRWFHRPLFRLVAPWLDGSSSCSHRWPGRHWCMSRWLEGR